MATFKVRMLAFGKPGEVREVDVPDDGKCRHVDDHLNLVYHYGQNDFQPKQHPSVSVGDVIEFAPGQLYIVCRAGFRLLTDKELAEYEAMDRRDRHFCDLVGTI